ncbi:MAG TPA: tetratricopeptide repeat protein [Gammaproteobacteria bacterium]|nr:tetratricopeptide repeat protein [Gammaproteobacteria bacterium]
MSVQHSEEEQIENLKAWWKENGPSVLFGLFIGVAVLFGWNYWKDQKARQAAEASALYTQMLVKMDSNQPADQYTSTIETLRSKYDDTAYAALAALLAAKLAVDQNNIDGAVKDLEWVIGNADQPEIKITAKLRLARLFLSQGNFGQTEALLNENYPEAYTAVAEELRGDLQVAKGSPETARQAYERALSASDIAPYTRQLIQNKLDQLTPPEPTDA